MWLASGWLLVAHTRPTTRPRFTRPSSSRSSRALASPHAPPTDSLARRPRHWGGRCTPRVLLARSLARSPLVACCSSLDRFAPSIQVVGIRRNSFSVISCFPLLRRWLAGWLAGQQAGRQKTSGLRSVVFSKGRTIYLCCHTPCIAMAPARPTSWRRGRRCRCSCRVQGSGRAGPPPE